MGNEMGNQNSNGLQVSKQEGEEVTKVINQFSNASFMSNELDGLKVFEDSNKPENEELATGGYLQPTVDMSQSILSRENDERESAWEFDTSEALKSSVMPKDYLDQAQAIPSTEYEAFEKHETDNLATEGSPDSLILSKDEYVNFALPNTSSEIDDSVIHRKPSKRRVAEEETDEACKTLNKDPEAFIITAGKIDLKELPHYLQDAPKSSEELEDRKSDTAEHMEHVDAPNDTEEMSQLTLSREHKDIQDEHNHLAYDESSKRADNLIQKQTYEKKGDDDRVKICAQESEKKGGELEDHTIDKQNECISSSTNQENIVQELSDKDIASTREMTQMNSSEAAEGSIDPDDQQSADVNAAAKDFGPMQQRDHDSDELVNFTYIDALDFEIKKLLMEDYINEMNEESEMESDGHEDASNEPSEEPQMDQIDDDSFEIQLKAIDFLEEEAGKDGLEEAVFEIALQTDYNPNLISKRQRKSLDGETERAEMEAAIATDIPAAARNPEEKSVYETGELKSNEIIVEEFHQFSSGLSNPKVAMHKETEEPACFIDVCRRTAACMENAEVAEKQNEDSNIMANVAEMPKREEEHGHGQFVDRSKVMPFEIYLKGQIVQIIPMEPRATSYQYPEEFVKEYTLNGYETPKIKDGITFTGENEEQRTFSGIPTLSKNTLLSAFESGSEKQLPDSVTQQNMTNNKEVEYIQIDQPLQFTSATNLRNLEGSVDNGLESIKCLSYMSERTDLEVQDISPSFISVHEDAATDDSNQLSSEGIDKATKVEPFENEDNTREYHVSAVDTQALSLVPESTYGEFDKSQLPERKSEDSELSATELSDSEKVRAPLSNVLREGTIVELPKKKDGHALKKTVKEASQSPRKSMSSLANGREKQKPRTSLFANCICCTTDIIEG